jgi:RNA polymerase sigma factor (sigma-70 family)
MATPLLENPDVAFERMYETYARIVYRYALAVLRNPADAEDITQTTFLNAYRAMKAGEKPLQPRHWLLKIAHNACRMRWVRNSRRPQEVPLEGKVEQLVMPEQERPNVRAVLDELGKLPFNQRSALVMRELEGRTYEEIAETLDVTVSAVETLLVRARRTMRLRRSAINVLGLVQLPASLESFFAGSAAVATGGAVVGSFAFKAAAMLVAGLVASGAGYTAVDAATKRSHTPRPEARAALPSNAEAVSYSRPAPGAKSHLGTHIQGAAKAKHSASTAKQDGAASLIAAPIGSAAPPATVPDEPVAALPDAPLSPADPTPEGKAPGPAAGHPVHPVHPVHPSTPAVPQLPEHAAPALPALPPVNPAPPEHPGPPVVPPVPPVPPVQPPPPPPVPPAPPAPPIPPVPHIP